MNPTLSPAAVDALLEALYRGIIRIRMCAATDGERAEAIADALHNIPRLLIDGQKWGWSIAKLQTLFLTPLQTHYPDLAGLSQPLDELADLK